MSEKFRDLQLESFADLVEDIAKENTRQLELWGIQELTLAEWMLFTTEELGEIADAIGEFSYRGGDPNEIYKEAIQTAVLALKIAEIAMSLEV